MTAPRRIGGREGKLQGSAPSRLLRVGGRRLAGDGDAQLMLGAGIVLASAFLTAMGVAVEISGMEGTVAAEIGDPVFPLDTWRELRLLVEEEARSITLNSTLADAFESTKLPRIAAVYGDALEDYNLGGRVSLFALGEASLHDGAYYDAWSHDAATHFTDPYFGSDDGVLQTFPCPAGVGDTSPCIIGIFLLLELSEHDYHVAEPVLFSLR